MNKIIEERLKCILETIDLEKNRNFEKRYKGDYQSFRYAAENIDSFESGKYRKNDDIRISNHITLKYKFILWSKSVANMFIDILNYDEKIKKSDLDFVNFKQEILSIRSMKGWKFILFITLFSKKNISLSIKMSDIMDNFLHMASFGDCQFLISKLLEQIENSYPELITNPISNKNQVNLEIIKEESEDQEFIQDEIQINLTKEEIFNLYKLKSELENQLDEVQGKADFYQNLYRDRLAEIEKIKKNYEKDSRLKVFKSLNSIESNNTLDNFYIIGQMMKNLDAQNWKPDNPELEEILNFIPLFENFLRNQQIYPMFEIGQTITIKLEQASEMDYIGDPFISSDEEKHVKVKKPGWRIEDTILSKPSVIEIKNR